MKTRLFHIFVFLLLVIGLDRGVGEFLRRKYFECKLGNIAHTNQVMMVIEPDLLIIGSSRASHHYVSEIIESALKITCFNAGADGTEIDYHAAVYYANVARYCPKMVIIDVNEFRFTEEGRSRGNLRPLAPYLGINERLDRLYYASDRWARFKILSAIFPFNSKLIDLFMGGGITVREKGYDPLSGQMRVDEVRGAETRMLSAIPDQTSLGILEDILIDARKRAIQVILIQSPRYTNAVENETLRQIANLAVAYSAHFVNDINHPEVYQNPEFFKDAAHLNHEGAQAYTRIVVGYLRHWAVMDGSNFTNPEASSKTGDESR